MSLRKPLIRRTFSQERYEILIKRQRDGKATFNELTELDEIVNRDPSIREIVLIENHFIPGNDEGNDAEAQLLKESMKPQHVTWLSKLKSAIHKAFTSHVVLKEKAVLSI